MKTAAQWSAEKNVPEAVVRMIQRDAIEEASIAVYRHIVNPQHETFGEAIRSLKPEDPIANV
jgi:hypothetical protein